VPEPDKETGAPTCNQTLNRDHLLRAGVDIAVIALWLDKLTPAEGCSSRFTPKDELLRFLLHSDCYEWRLGLS
jgi:hypothetical protein